MAGWAAEMTAIQEKVVRLATLLSDFDGSVEEGRMISRQLAFVDRRLSIVPDSEDVRPQVATIREQLDVLRVRYNGLVEALGEWEAQNPQEASLSETNHIVRKHVPVSKWGLVFSGEESGTSLGAFLERVEELCVARNVSEESLWSEAVDLFQGAALVWFRSTRRRIQSWAELVSELRSEFQPSDYDDRLMSEIRARTQGETEPLGLYLSAMDNLFARLSYEVDASDQLKIIKKNILPYLMEKLCLQKLDSVEKIRLLGRKVEESRRMAEQFRPPPPARSSLEPDLAFRGSVRPRARVEEVVASQPSSTPTAPASFCWNCKGIGHRFRQCPNPRGETPFCFGCGHPNTIQTRCQTPRCKKAGNAGGSLE